MKEHQTIFSIKELKNKLKFAFTDGIPNLETKLQIIKNWQKNLKSSKYINAKEEEIKSLFLTQFFGDILGYDYNNSNDWNLRFEYKSSIDSTKSDAALGFFKIRNNEEQPKDVRAVIEIKDARTALDKPQNRKDFKGTPIEQCFNYAAKIGENCKWAIISNFLEIRLYLAGDMTKYESFDIMTLDDYNEFMRFYFLFSNGQLFNLTMTSAVDKLLSLRIEKEKSITKDFYSFYHHLRELFFYHLKSHNPTVNSLLLLEYTQTIIDRIVFVSVIKDYELIPTNILKEIEDLSEKSWAKDKQELWRQLKHFFIAIDEGMPPRIQKFNGGLFRYKKQIDDLNISNIALKKLLAINNYDFESDLNVNILGHIFEQSISDIELLKKNIFEDKQLEYIETDEDIELKISPSITSKRKKEGIFYTPENITYYIVKSTIGAWLEEKKKSIGIYDLDDHPQSKEEKELQISLWEQYKVYLKNIKILDPACGSGAFLTQAFDYLLNEWQMVLDVVSKLQGETGDILEDGLFVNAPTKRQQLLSQIKKNIVNNNLFGVDLNNESVEITKLGLWLKSASKNDPLALLDRNIQCGNSLISDKNISEKAFNWEERFMNLYNPQKYYEIKVAEYKEKIRLAKAELEILLNKRQNRDEDDSQVNKLQEKISGQKTHIQDLEYELGEIHEWIKDNTKPILGFDIIIGNPPYISTKVIAPIEKKYFVDNYSCATGQFDLYGLFIEKSIKLLNQNSKFGFITSNTYLSNKDFHSLRKFLFENVTINEITNLGETVFTDANLDVAVIIFSMGINENNKIKITLNNEDFNKNVYHFIAQSRFDSEINNYEIKLNSKEEDFNLIDKIFKDKIELASILYLPRGIEIGRNSNRIMNTNELGTHKLLVGKDISKYSIHFADRYIKFEDDKAVFKDLEIYLQPKILIQRIRNLSLKTRIVATLDNDNYLCTNTLRIGIQKNKDFDLSFLLAILNSKLINWIFSKYFLNKDIYAYQLERLPIPSIDLNQQNTFSELVDKIIEINKVINEILHKFQNNLVRNFSNLNISTMLQKFYQYDFNEFIGELSKQKIKISLKKQDEWFDYFNERKLLINENIILNNVRNKKIDDLVYKLYELTDKEIELIEMESK